MQLSFVGIDNASSTINFCHIHATFLTRRMTSVRWTRSLVMSSWRRLTTRKTGCLRGLARDYINWIFWGEFPTQIPIFAPRFLVSNTNCKPFVLKMTRPSKISNNIGGTISNSNFISKESNVSIRVAQLVSPSLILWILFQKNIPPHVYRYLAFPLVYSTRKNIQNNPPPKTTKKNTHPTQKANTGAKTTSMFQEFSKWFVTGYNLIDGTSKQRQWQVPKTHTPRPEGCMYSFASPGAGPNSSSSKREWSREIGPRVFQTPYFRQQIWYHPCKVS